MSRKALFLACAALLLAGLPASAQVVAPPEQLARYEAQAPKTILELQPFRQATSVTAQGADGRALTATLVDLSPAINAWFLLTLAAPEGGTASYHLHNPDPERQRLRLEPEGLVIADDDGGLLCGLWSDGPEAIARAAATGLPFAPLCEGRLYLRNPVAGRRTDLERVADFLRDHVWGGDALVGFVRDRLFRDAHRETGTAAPAAGHAPEAAGAPPPAALGEAYAGRAVAPRHLGIELEGVGPSGPLLGRWYGPRDIRDIWLSVIQPQALAPAILESHPQLVSRLDSVEAGALAYLIAFDLDAFDLGFALGSDHPRLGWSPRPPDEVRDQRLPGPDGVGSPQPLVTNGMVPPFALERTVAAFAGGFKREHGAFRYGDLSLRNRGSHYGFIEEGVIFSKLQPGLATLYVLRDGTVGMKTWREADDRLLPEIRHARQNGVAIVEPEPASGAVVPGALVARWGPGNWSGSASGELRTLRGGACLLEAGERRFLVYGWFSTATPSAMARVFQAYGCAYGMLLDMNALEHTYLALYLRQGGVVSGGEAVVGEVAGRTAVIVDDLISTGTTLARAAAACRAAGAEAVHAVVTHGLFTGDAGRVVATAGFARLVITSTVPPFRLDPATTQAHLTVLDAAPLLAEAIRRLHHNQPLEPLRSFGLPKP